MTDLHEKILNDLCRATGWDLNKVKEFTSQLKCHPDDALNAFLCYGKMPDINEQNLLNHIGFKMYQNLYDLKN